jgi:hypothetical protein
MIQEGKKEGKRVLLVSINEEVSFTKLHQYEAELIGRNLDGQTALVIGFNGVATYLSYAVEAYITLVLKLAKGAKVYFAGLDSGIVDYVIKRRKLPAENFVADVETGLLALGFDKHDFEGAGGGGKARGLIQRVARRVFSANPLRKKMTKEAV